MRLALLMSAAALAAASAPARAETLQEAIASAYESNPVLQQQRAQQRGLDETYVQARTGFRPTVGVSGSGTSLRDNPPSGGGYTFNSGSVALSASQPLYTGGRASASVRAGEAQVLAGRESLRATEAAVLQQVVGAYEDVRRDQQILAIRQSNLEVLKTQLDETTAKYEVGQVTRTDVAQAKAQFAQAKSLLSTAQGDLRNSRAAYLSVIGHEAADLSPEPELPGMPATVDEAFDVAEHNNPTLKGASLSEEASRAKVAEAKAARMPTVSAGAQFGYTNSTNSLSSDRYDRQLSATVTVTQPLFSGGLVSSQVRQALEQNTSDRIGVEKARRDAVQQVSVAWSGILSTGSSLSASQEQRDAAAIAFEGTREEYRAGLRTTLDVLIAEQTLRDSELAVVTARHDSYIARAQLLAAIGRLEARALSAPVKAYDPADNFRKVRNANSTIIDRVVESAEGAVTPK